MQGVSGPLGGGWTLDFSESPTDPPGGRGWTLDLSESPTNPLGGGGRTLDFEKERIQVARGGWYKVTLVLRRFLVALRRTAPKAAQVGTPGGLIMRHPDGWL